MRYNFNGRTFNVLSMQAAALRTISLVITFSATVNQTSPSLLTKTSVLVQFHYTHNICSNSEHYPILFVWGQHEYSNALVGFYVEHNLIIKLYWLVNRLDLFLIALGLWPALSLGHDLVFATTSGFNQETKLRPKQQQQNAVKSSNTPSRWQDGGGKQTWLAPTTPVPWTMTHVPLTDRRGC